ncbi:MAG: Crp/Fnr family transcriptional regulator [Lachnospiraceae bacterium]|nr:Crp/Fnr family transcriptional regulator [Lachnospiraceae bacterium]
MKEIVEKYRNILRDSGVFEDVAEDKYQNVLYCLHAKTVSFQQGEVLQTQGELTKRAGIVLAGQMEEYLYDEDGNQLTIERLGSGNIFGVEILCAAQLPSQIYLCASSDCEALLLDFGMLLSEKTLGCIYRMQVSANLMKKFARQVNFLSTRIRILSQKKLRNRLKIYLQTQDISPDGEIILAVNREKMAEILGVDRSALSRELCRMREEGILTVSRNKITLLRRNFLDV